MPSHEFASLTSRLPDVIEQAVEAGVHRMITVATDGDDAIAARETCQHIDSRVFFSSGIHPLHAQGPWKWEYVVSAAKDPRCVAWGELGLDRHYDKPPFALQLELLEEHLACIESRNRG